MKYLSLFSGIEAATVAWHGLGWEPVGFAEIEKFPEAVLKHHFPDVKNYGDVTKYKEWNIEPGTIDVVVGGSPCQAFSVAGLRGGLKAPRGNLMLTYGALAGHLRPRVIVWENVPGVLLSNGGRDFGTFLGMLAELGYGFAYRILDAQYVRVESHRRAVPQRRRRVFVVGYLGDWRRAAEVLFESESLRGYPPPSRKAGERVAGDSEICFEPSRRDGVRLQNDGTVPTPQAFGGTGGGNQPCVTQKNNDLPYRDDKDYVRCKVCGKRYYGSDSGVCEDCQITQPYTVGNCLTRRMHKGINTTLDEGQTPVLGYHTTDGFLKESEEPGTLRAREQDSHENVMVSGYSVRRLTPEECERLQGFPTGWTRIPWRNKSAEDCPDGPRYKAIGNSMAVNVMRWIGERIQKYE